MTREPRTRDELIEASDHLQYEIMMVVETAHMLSHDPVDHFTVRNALLESFAIHSRVLLTFLYAEHPRPDDVIAEDYAPEWPNIRPPEPLSVASAHHRVGKEIVHLTYKRLSVSEEAKNWRIREMVVALRDVLIPFLQRVPDDLFGSNMIRYKAAIFDRDTSD